MFIYNIHMISFDNDMLLKFYKCSRENCPIFFSRGNFCKLVKNWFLVYPIESELWDLYWLINNDNNSSAHNCIMLMPFYHCLWTIEYQEILSRILKIFCPLHYNIAVTIPGVQFILQKFTDMLLHIFVVVRNWFQD